MDDDDSVLVALQWWHSQNSARVCITGIVAQIDSLGISRPRKKNCTLRELLIHFGNRLVEEKLVQLKKPAGLCKDDVIVLNM